MHAQDDEQAEQDQDDRQHDFYGAVCAGGLFDEDRSHLAAELDASRARERELEAAGQAASQALGRAIAGVRTALGD